MQFPLASRDPGLVRDALMRRGMDEERAEATARNLRSYTLLFDSLDSDSIESLTRVALLRGVDVVSGKDWVVLSGSTTQLAGLSRSGPNSLPETLMRTVGSALHTASLREFGWSTARGEVTIDKPMVAGIVNVTPDSFSDGGKYLSCDDARAHVERLVEDGADMIDVGAESTRPGQPDQVPVEEEWRRLEPVLAALNAEHPSLPVSVDTVKSTVAERAIDAGAWAINDVSALRLDPRIADVCAASGAGLILNHSRGAFSDMAGYEHAKYSDVTGEVISELMTSVETAEGRGMEREQLVLDPGLGFAKTPEQSITVIRELALLTSLGLPVMVGPSRKRFLGEITGKDVEDRDTATAASCVAAYHAGAYLFRVHDVKRVKESLIVAEELRSN